MKLKRGDLDYADSDAAAFAEFNRGYDKMIAAYTEEELEATRGILGG